MRWLTLGNTPGDALFFHYSGHGSRRIDKSGIESDGYDETIVPLDFDQSAEIVDDEVRLVATWKDRWADCFCRNINYLI